MIEQSGDSDVRLTYDLDLVRHSPVAITDAADVTLQNVRRIDAAPGGEHHRVEGTVVNNLQRPEGSSDVQVQPRLPPRRPPRPRRDFRLHAPGRGSSRQQLTAADDRLFRTEARMRLIPHHQDDGRREYRSPDGAWRVVRTRQPGRKRNERARWEVHERPEAHGPWHCHAAFERRRAEPGRVTDGPGGLRGRARQKLSRRVRCSRPARDRLPSGKPGGTAMKTIAGSALVLGAFVCLSASVAAQTLVGALAIDEGQGDQYGWAVDYETTSAARTRALSECGSGCSVVLTFERCAAYAADQEEDSTVYGWAESYDSSAGARQRALAECGTRGSGCTVRVWGCNGPVVEEGLGLDRAARRQVQEGLQAAGFDPGGADGMFGPRTRAAIRSWQTSRGARATGYLDGASVAALRPSVAGQPTSRERSSAGAAATPAAPAAVSAARQQSSATSSEVDVVFWQSIANSTNPAEFEAYLSQFPNGVFRTLAEVRLAALRAGSSAAPAAAGVGGTPATGSRVSGTPAAGVDTRPSAGTVFRPDQACVGQAVGASCWMDAYSGPNRSLIPVQTDH